MSFPVAGEPSSICIRCLRKQIFTATRKPACAAKRAYATIDKNSQPEQTAPRPKLWTTLVKSQYLGKSTSVLVLRDPEAKKRAGPADSESVKHINAAPTKMADLLASMEAEEGVQGLGDAHKAIESERPAGRPEARLTRQQAEDLADHLAQSFSKPQLATYVAMKQASQIVEEQVVVEQHTQIHYSPWRPIDESGNLAKPAQNKQKGKREAIRGPRRKLAEVVLRNVWGVSIFEEEQQIGILTMDVDSAGLDMLSSGRDDSILTRIARAHGTKVTMSNSSKRITIAANRVAAEEAAAAIRNVLAALHEENLDLGPLYERESSFSSAYFQGAIPLQTVQHIGRRFDCRLEQSDSPHLIRISTLDKAQADRCRRALYAAVDPAVGEERVYLESPEVIDPSNLHVLSDGTYDRLLDASLARLRMPVVLSKGDTPTRVHVQENKISQETFLKTLDFLAGGAVEQAASNHALSASFGHLGIWQSPNQQENAERLLQASREGSGGRRAFMPTKSGLPELLAQRLGHESPIDKSKISVDLVPSPWHVNQNESENAPQRLRLTFDIDGSSRRVIFRSLHGVSNERKANVLLPGLSTDVRLESSALADLSSQQSVAALAKDDAFSIFVKEVENTGSGYSKISAPPFLEVKSASIGLGSEREQSPSDTYFTESIELLQELCFDFNGFNLTYTLYGGNESSQRRDVLALHTHAAPQRFDKSSPDAGGFLSSINDILFSLNAGIRNRDWDEMLPTGPDSVLVLPVEKPILAKVEE